MLSNKIILFLTNLIIILTLGIFLNPNISNSQSLISQINLKNEQKPKTKPNPTTTGGAGSRGGSCLAATDKIIPLLPPDQQEQNRYGFTVSPYPTFLAYIPETTATEGQLILKNEQNRVITKKSFKLPEQSGIVTLSFNQTDTSALKQDQWYQWFVLIVCNPDNPDDNATSDGGWIQYFEPSADLTTKISKAAPEEVFDIYAREDIWYEAVSNLAELRLSNPDNSKLEKQWQELLQSLKLEEDLSNKTLLNCCQIEIENFLQK